VLPYLADRYGLFNVEVPSILLAGMLGFAWIAAHNVASIVVFAIIYGFFAGATTTISPTIAVTLCPSMGVVGMRFGMLLISLSIGLLRSGRGSLRISCKGNEAWVEMENRRVECSVGYRRR